MIGLGLRRAMQGWDLPALGVDFVEVAPENWLRRDRAPLHALRAAGVSVRLHGVSLNLGGTAPLNGAFLRQVRALMDELQTPFYSDHLAASGDAHQLYDLFPVPFTAQEAQRVGDRIAQAQDLLGHTMAVENATWYTNHGPMPEPEFIAAVLQRAGCQWLLDLNNVVVNHKNHGQVSLVDFVRQADLSRVSYVHVAGHEWDEHLGMHIDTHSRSPETATRRMAVQLHQTYGLDVLLEWDHDLPRPQRFERELACLRRSLTTCAA